jgi:hypothetical protein
MDWDEEISAYQQRKNKEILDDSAYEESSRYLSQRGRHHWMDLRKAFTDECNIINQKANRDMITSRSNLADELKLELDGDSTLTAQYDNAINVVEFSGCEGCGRKYTQMAKKAERGEFIVSWYDLATKKRVEPAVIVETLLKAFLRSNG